MPQHSSALYWLQVFHAVQFGFHPNCHVRRCLVAIFVSRFCCRCAMISLARFGVCLSALSDRCNRHWMLLEQFQCRCKDQCSYSNRMSSKQTVINVLMTILEIRCCFASFCNNQTISRGSTLKSEGCSQAAASGIQPLSAVHSISHPNRHKPDRSK